MNKILILMMSIGAALSFTACSHVINKQIFVNKVQKNIAFIKSDFESLDACQFALAIGELENAKFLKSSCGLTKKQFIAYSSDNSGNLEKKLIYLNYDDIEGVAIARYGRGAQVQLKINTGLVVLQPGGGQFIDLDTQNKYLKIFKKYGVKEFEATKYILMENSGTVFIPIII